MIGREVVVRVPATSANLGPGFDTMGLALGLYDELRVTAFDDDRLEIDVRGEGADSVPRDASHLVVTAMDRAFSACGFARPGLRIQAINAIPHGRGLGSSGAAVVAGVLAVAGLLDEQCVMSREMMLRLATEHEGHPDNVAAALLGGFTLSWVEQSVPHCVQVPLNNIDWAPLVFVPEFTVSTREVRTVSSPDISRDDAVFNISRAALLTVAMTAKPRLIFSATEDRVHQSERATAYPETYALVQHLRSRGFAAVVSGAGPSVLVFAETPQEHAAIIDCVEQREDGLWKPLILTVDVQGATVVRNAEGTTF